MADTLYLTPAGTPPLSPAQAPRKRKITLNESQLHNGSAKSKKPATITSAPKLKQTKSRNGCHTCKAKRLKCDEGKPTCQQCARRNVECEGYKKEFKWKGFPEQNIGRRLTGASQSAPAASTSATASEDGAVPLALLQQALGACSSPSSGNVPDGTPPSVQTQNSDSLPSSPPEDTSSQAQKIRGNDLCGASPDQENAENQVDFATEFINDVVSDDLPPSFTYDFASESVTRLLNEAMTPISAISFDHVHDDFNTAPIPSDTSFGFSELLEGSPQIDSDLNQDGPRSAGDIQSPNSDHSGALTTRRTSLQYSSPDLSAQIHLGQNSGERLMRRFFTSTCSIMSIFPLTHIGTSKSNPWQHLIWPMVQSGDCPMLYHALMSMACFHNYQSEPSLRLEGTTHMRKSLEYLHQGQQWLYCPVEVTLATCIALAFSESWMCWKRNIKSGSSHIKTAKQCLMYALQEGAQTRMQKKQLRFLCKTYLYADVIARLTSVDEDTENDAFDGIAAKVLGTDQGGETPERVPGDSFSTGAANATSLMAVKARLDPLMGSASSLFPIIGRVANLVRRVYRTSSSTPSTISQAQQLKSQLETWVAPSLSGEFAELHEHTTLTAEAYRLATLLHLHQSVPELLPTTQQLSTFAADIGMRTLNCVARIPPTSNTIIVHIYPLLVGGCEAQNKEDRQWVRDRWQAMEGRMGIGNVEKAREVVDGVWVRRDEANMAGGQEQAQQFICPDQTLLGIGATNGYTDSRIDTSWIPTNDEYSFEDVFGSSLESFDIVQLESSAGGSTRRPKYTYPQQSVGVEEELTVRGRLHWVGVMAERGWELLLG